MKTNQQPDEPEPDKLERLVRRCIPFWNDFAHWLTHRACLTFSEQKLYRVSRLDVIAWNAKMLGRVVFHVLTVGLFRGALWPVTSAPSFVSRSR